MRLILRLLGLAVLLLALWPAWREARSLGAAAHRFIPLGQIWREVSPGSIDATRLAIQRHAGPGAWDQGIQVVLAWPAWPTLAGLGVVVLVATAPRRRL